MTIWCFRFHYSRSAAVIVCVHKVCVIMCMNDWRGVVDHFADVVDCPSPKLFINTSPAVSDTTYFCVSPALMTPVFTFL